MLAAVRVGAVAIGVAVGGLVTTVAALVLWFPLSLLKLGNAPLAALTFGLLLGLLAAGYAAGRLAVHSHRFHGMLTGLLTAGFVAVLSRLGGSPAGSGQVLLLAVIGMALGGIGGVVGGRHRPSTAASVD